MNDLATKPSLDVRPLSGVCGAEIHGVDLAADLDAATIAAIRQTLLDTGVIFFRNQELTVEAQKRIARRFGDIFVHPNYKGLGGDDEIVEIKRAPGDKKIVGEDWHSDTTMMPEPPMGAILYALEVPAYGGDTMFASQYAAYEALSPGMKRLIANLKAYHTDRMVAGPAANKNAHRTTKVREDDAWRETMSVHPVVVTHPENGRKLLYVNHSYSVGFEDMSEAESKPLLDFLLNHGHRPEFTCRFRWEKGSVAFWDNRAVKHLAVHDSHMSNRYMRRVQLTGTRPV